MKGLKVFFTLHLLQGQNPLFVVFTHQTQKQKDIDYLAFSRLIDAYFQ
jgi:hypothetical protein